MSSKTVVLITGANTGIGYETVRALLHSSTAYHILLGARSAKKSEDAAERLRDEEPNSASTIDGVVVDIESDESIGKCLKDVEALVDHVDVLINNAGR